MNSLENRISRSNLLLTLDRLNQHHNINGEIDEDGGNTIDSEYIRRQYAQDNKNISDAFMQAMIFDEFSFHYQPIVEWDQKEQKPLIKYFEALLRWNRKTGNFGETENIPLGAFIELFELNGFIISITDTLIYRTLTEDFNKVPKDKQVPISINLQPKHLNLGERLQANDLLTSFSNIFSFHPFSDQNYLASIREFLDNKSNSPEIILELLEREEKSTPEEYKQNVKSNSVDMSAYRKHNLAYFLRESKKYNFPVFSDDFGHGINTEARLFKDYLKGLKVDRDETWDLLQYNDNGELLKEHYRDLRKYWKHIKTCATKTKIKKVVAEGIETYDHLAVHLQNIKVATQFQGYLFSPPLEVDMAVSTLLNNDIHYHMRKKAQMQLDNGEIKTNIGREIAQQFYQIGEY